MLSGISQKARALAEGLIRTGRATEARAMDGHLQLRAKSGGGYYWITADGSRLLRGDELEIAEELQQKFADSMVRAGDRKLS